VKNLSLRSRKLLISAVAVLIVIGFVAFFTREQEPEFNGKPLSHWVGVYGDLGPISGTDDEKAKAAEAIRAIGTNAIPFLWTWMDYEPGLLDRMVAENRDQFPEWLNSMTQFFFNEDAELFSLNAYDAFGALGPVAEPAIPELQSYLAGPDTYRASVAFTWLMRIGPKTVPIAIDVISNPGTNMDLYSTQLYSLRYLGTNIAAVVPFVLKNLEHTNTAIATNTVHGLYFLNYRDAAIASALARALSDPRVEVRRTSVEVLWRYGDTARIALPALTNALMDADSDVRDYAGFAIWSLTSTNEPASGP